MPVRLCRRIVAMDPRPPGNDARQLPDQQGTTNAALQAFERLSIQSHTPVKAEHSPSPPLSSSFAAQSSNATLSSPTNRPPSRPPSLRPSSSSGPAPIASGPPPQLRKHVSTSSLNGPISPSSPHYPSSRRTSSNLPIRPGPQLSAQGEPEAPKAPTPASVGAEFFAKELEAHATSHADTETLVIIHEACYGHRFSRPKTSKAALSTIVERPERITAAVLGLSTAYVRLGSRHAGGLAPPHPSKEHGHKAPFAIRQSSRSVGLLSPAVTAIHGLEWMTELQAMCLAAGERLALDGKELLRSTKVDAAGNPVAKAQFHEGDLYLCAESLDALQGAVGGVCDAVDAVFNESLTKRAFVAVRPPGHHCSADFPSGFCWLNNVHVGIQHAAQLHGLTHAVILDFDLHHGDGSQDITWDINQRGLNMPKNTPHSRKISIGYYSLHDINSYPCEMGDREKVQNASLCIDNAHGQSIWNVHLEPWSSESDFLRLYETKYSVIFEKARSFLSSQTARIKTSPKGGKPRSAVFISAGFDASQWEGAGMQRHAVNVPTSFYERFTKDAVKLALDESTAAEGRVISVLEGGYSNRALTSGVLSHISGLCQPSSSANVPIEPNVNGALQMTQVLPADSKWWNSEALHALETYEPTDISMPKPRTGYAPTFATPTASFSNKVVDHEKFYRSVSGTMRPLPEPELIIPDVDWIAASHALCKVLIPTHRTTTSCRPEDLAVVRPKKPRQSLPAVVAAQDSTPGRQLRDRKAKATNGALSEDESKANIRTPIAKGDVKPRRTTSRRSSAASGTEPMLQNKATPPPAVPSIPAAYAHSLPSTPAPGLNLKKTRRSPTKAAAASKPGPLPTGVSTAKPKTPPSLTTQSSATSVDTALSSSTSTGGELDSLTSAVKRITLKVGTREEHDRRVRAAQEAERLAKVKKPTSTTQAQKVTAPAASAPGSKQPPAAQSMDTPFPAPIAEAVAQQAQQVHEQKAAVPIDTLLNPAETPVRQAPQQQQQQQVMDSAARQLHSEMRAANNMGSPVGYTPQQQRSQQIPGQQYQHQEGRIPTSPLGQRLPSFSATGVIPFGSASGTQGQRQQQ